MSEIIEGFKLQRQLRQEEQRNKKQDNTQRLRDEGITFSTKNDGNHLIIIIGQELISFYPSTGKWLVHSQRSKTVYGIESLLDYIKLKKESKQ